MDNIERFFQRGLKLSHLRLLTLFANLGQIRLVAERLNVTQPAVSKQLAELELGLGGPVVMRVGNRLQFTALGEALLKRAREVLLQLEQARHEVDALCSGLSGNLSVGAVPTVLPVLAPEITLQMKAHAPNVSITLFEATSDSLFPMLVTGALDLVFSRMQPPASTMGFVSETILEDPMVIVCGTQNPLASRRGLSPADLAGMLWILPTTEAPTFIALKQWAEQNKLSFPPGCVQSTSLLSNERLLKRYPFIGLLPRSVALDHTNREELKVLHLPGSSFLGTVWVFYSKAKASPVLNAALDCIPLMRDELADRHRNPSFG